MSALQSEGLFIPINFYLVCHTLIVRVRSRTEIYRLILYAFGIFQVLLDVQSLKKLKKLPNFVLCLSLWLNLIV